MRVIVREEATETHVWFAWMSDVAFAVSAGAALVEGVWLRLSVCLSVLLTPVRD